MRKSKKTGTHWHTKRDHHNGGLFSYPRFSLGFNDSKIFFKHLDIFVDFTQLEAYNKNVIGTKFEK